MIDLDALKAELEADGYLVISNGHSLYVATHTLERLTPHCRVYNDGDVWWREERRDGPLREIIARHVAPVVTPEPDAEARDVLAEALYFAQCDATFIPFKKREYEYQRLHADADAGLAALRARGFAVVRTADVEAAMCDARNFRLQMRGWERADGTPVYEMDDDTEERLEEAIR